MFFSCRQLLLIFQYPDGIFFFELILVVFFFVRSTDVSLWNSNGTSVDLFLQQSAVADAGRTLATNNVRYSVVIEDLQKAIDEENPPEQDIEYQDRAGKTNILKFIIFLTQVTSNRKKLK